MDSKAWFKSKSIWLGAIACGYGLVRWYTGGIFSIEELTAIYAGLATIFIRLGIQ